jgi:hypothetical protein
MLFPLGFIAPCLPAKADTLPSGGMWLHEPALAITDTEQNRKDKVPLWSSCNRRSTR